MNEKIIRFLVLTFGSLFIYLTKDLVPNSDIVFFSYTLALICLFIPMKIGKKREK